ncbi:hypothetical protein GCM10025865_10740 [Paraoerskovia sediminicola]|uniref:HTH marR-type domain-containing protein n=1 Tax=Paraoerskovia sediminicola TaxID=1138587 RepID=A0ABM8G126_9CELL|nr:MarR family transcriptional regulator [Paraoerskovia sediminicola]BDZ41775.1 hypothetical protein GCM10025865_10740 [Paraoerskovia sediminicola]
MPASTSPATTTSAATPAATRPDGAPDVGTLAFELRGALAPIWRRLIHEKTLPLGKSRALVRLEAVPDGGATSASLAASEQITPQSMAAIVADLVADGLVERTRDPHDRRRLTLTITDAGRDAVAEDRRATHGWLASAVAERLDDQDRAALAAVLPVLHKLTDEVTDV